MTARDIFAQKNMRSNADVRGRTATRFIQLDTTVCMACWKCMETCRNNVIGRINLPWHKHALIVRRESCTGCLKCVNACSYNAICKTGDTGQKGPAVKSSTSRLIINLGMLISGFASVYSGFLIQFNYHVGHHGSIDMEKAVYSMNYTGWTVFHKVAIVSMSVVAAGHIIQHRRWYKTVIAKSLMRGNRQTLFLSVTFILVALTGYVSWFIDMTGNDPAARKTFMEIHDKLTLVLSVLLLLHLTKRAKR